MIGESRLTWRCACRPSSTAERGLGGRYGRASGFTMDRMNSLAQELLRVGLLSVHDFALALLDPDGVIVGWRWGSEEIYGYSESEIVGRPVSTIFVPEDVEKGLHALELDAARRHSSSQDDRWHLRKDGSRIWVSGTVTAVREGSKLLGFLKMMRDRTDLRMAAETRANQVSALEDALARTRQFLQTLGHELRNPLSPIKNAAHIASRASNEPRVQRASEMFIGQVALLERLTADLMHVSRLQHKKLELRLSNVNVRALAAQEAAGYAPAARAKGVEIQVLLPEGELPALADADRLRQALSNLIGNPVKYTPARGTIWVKVTQEAEDVVVRVQDTGIGIAPEVLPRIFELFTQEVRAKGLVPGGLGIGLAIVSQIAELHGGVVQARSAGTGKGSEFTLRIPRGGPPLPGLSSEGPAVAAS